MMRIDRLSMARCPRALIPTTALLLTMGLSACDLPGGTSWMEDYTYDLNPKRPLVLGSHMLEVCPSIAVEEKPILDVQYLGIGGKADPARLIFNTRTGPAINASLIDLGDPLQIRRRQRVRRQFAGRHAPLQIIDRGLGKRKRRARIRHASQRKQRGSNRAHFEGKQLNRGFRGGRGLG